jgi:hypothetical protein
MSMLQYYAHLAACLNGDLLMEQTGITIEDSVNEPCRVTIDSALPEKGAEVDPRTRLGELVTVGVFILGSDRKLSTALLEVEGKIIASEISQPPGKPARVRFTVEQECVLPPEARE